MDEVRPHARPMHSIDKYGPKFVSKAEKFQGKAIPISNEKSNEDESAGGFDDTPIPHAPPGYTLKFTFHRAINLPFADFNTLSSDPYVKAQLNVDLPKRHKQDPNVVYRTPTVHRSTDPVWEREWIVANVPASGFELKCRVFDEDPADHDDRLGVATVGVDSIHDDWPGIQEQTYKVRKRMASKRVYFFRNVAAITRPHHDREAHLVVSIANLGKTPGDDGGRMYTAGPCYLFKHFSPLIGRIAGTKYEVNSEDGKKGVMRYNFQAIQMQFQGPVPSQLYHRFVDSRPVVAGIFKARTLGGRILKRALHHQHERVYNFDGTTVYDEFPSPCVEFSQKFLEFVHYGQGGRMFTYVLTLDGQFRFTETGREFKIDLLSKHTMHSDVSDYIAFSGEFFMRPRKSRQRQGSSTVARQESFASASSPTEEAYTETSTDPADYELFIDNDSGTYRPNGKCLPLLREFISANLPGLHVTTLDCQKDAEQMKSMKEEQMKFKNREGHPITLLQQSSSSSLSLSSSDEEVLDEVDSRSLGQEGRVRDEPERHEQKNRA